MVNRLTLFKHVKGCERLIFNKDNLSMLVVIGLAGVVQEVDF